MNSDNMDDVRKAIMEINEAILSRQDLLSKAGVASQYGGKRDVSEACGYPPSLEFYDFMETYSRGDIAKNLVEAYPDYTWSSDPVVFESNNKTKKLTKWDKSFIKFVRKTNLFSVMHKLDILAGIGRYAVLLVGFQDGDDLSRPVEKGKNVMYLQPYGENAAMISEWVMDKKDARYGKPLMYQITAGMSTTSTTGGTVGMSLPFTETFPVHYSRIIHVADNCLENSVHGIPRLQNVYNRLMDVMKVASGSAEMFWRGGFPGYSFEAKDGVQLPEGDDLKKMNEAIQEYVHGLNRYLKLQGIETKQLNPQLESPKDHFDIQLSLISAASKIPKRVLLGSEQSVLAADQDTKGWNSRVMRRRLRFAEPMMLRALIDTMMKTGILESVDDYEVKWPGLDFADDEKQADIAKKKTEAIVAYSNSSANQLVPPKAYLTDILGVTEVDSESYMEQALDELELENEEDEIDVSTMPSGKTEPQPEVVGKPTKEKAEPTPKAKKG